MNQEEYEAKRQARYERLLAAAERTEREGQASWKQGEKMFDAIPFGQPILVGHYSERTDRNYRNRADGKLRRGYDLLQRAKEYRSRAESVLNNTAISSDDPDAIEKLREKLEKLQAKQEYMKRINKIHRAYVKDPASLDKEELTDQERETIINYAPRYSWEPNPFPQYALTNNNGNIKNVRDRIEKLESHAQDKTAEKEYGDIKVVDNVEANRLQIFFLGKPSAEVRSTLKSHGFRWTPSVGCWQAYRDTHAQWVLEKIINQEV